jgi:sterol desaturase/sphingolipid hydroxylase (fatty acid hydroxylase superfamily)
VLSVYWFWTAYFGLGLACMAFEVARPAHKVNYRKGVPFDLVALFIYQLAIWPGALWLTSLVQLRYSSPVFDVPLWARVIVFYIGADLMAYWIHRLIHTRHLWRIHRFHHSPTQLYWLAGVRASLPQQILFNAPYIFVGPLILDGPLWLGSVIVIEAVARNHWMHMNFAWRSNWIELVFVTPRYHHIHHSTNADEHDGNYGALFTFWDRLFRTRVDPDGHTPKKFGTGEPKNRDPVLLMLGI